MRRSVLDYAGKCNNTFQPWARVVRCYMKLNELANTTNATPPTPVLPVTTTASTTSTQPSSTTTLAPQDAPDCSHFIALISQIKHNVTQCKMSVTSLQNQLTTLHTRKQEIATELHKCDNDRREMNEAIVTQTAKFHDQEAQAKEEVDRHQGVVDNLLHKLKLATASHNVTKTDLADLQTQYVEQKKDLQEAKDSLQMTVRQAESCTVMLHREKRHRASLKKDYERLLATTDTPEPQECQSSLDTNMSLYYGLAAQGMAILALLASVSYLAVTNYNLRRQPGGRIPVGPLNNETQDGQDQELHPQRLGTPPPRHPRHEDAAQALAQAAGRVGFAAAPPLIKFS